MPWQDFHAVSLIILEDPLSYIQTYHDHGGSQLYYTMGPRSYSHMISFVSSNCIGGYSTAHIFLSFPHIMLSALVEAKPIAIEYRIAVINN